MVPRMIGVWEVTQRAIGLLKPLGCSLPFTFGITSKLVVRSLTQSFSQFSKGLAMLHEAGTVLWGLVLDVRGVIYSIRIRRTDCASQRLPLSTSSLSGLKMRRHAVFEA